MRERGFSAVQAGIVLATIAAIVGAHVMVYQQGYGRGAADKQVEWDQADSDAQDEADELRGQLAVALAEKDAAAREADGKARDSDNDWRRRVRDAERKGIALAVCESPVHAAGASGDAGSGIRPPVGADGAVDRSGPRIRLSWQFVHDVDAAWTGLGGQPVSTLASGAAWPAGPGAASPYYLEDARDAAGENALRCSQDRRELHELTMKIRAAADAVDRARQ